ncbi:MAG: right-handed parallel beta-helix repeat-containing protein [Thermoplasmatales archaeon]|nr:MAG: right-handed parallel beta-helix repeat-containing protein [Thermoplasmatales archaeon]
MKKQLEVFVIFIIICLANCMSISALTITNENEKIPAYLDTITVDDEGDGDFLNLQSAIEESDPGTTINVYSGNYEETSTIQINIADLTIVGINYELGAGGDSGPPIIIGNSNGDVINISSDNISISGLGITNSGFDFINLDAAIHIHSNNNHIDGNYLAGSYYAISIHDGNDNEISNNIIELNQMDGIFMYNSDNNSISLNTIINNGFQGIYLYDCEDNFLYKNILKLNDKNGIHFFDLCTGNIVYQNTIESNSVNGIKLTTNNIGNVIIDNVIKSNGWSGIQIQFSNSNLITKNEIDSNMYDGILAGELADSDGNMITGNNISYNSEQGIRFGISSNDNIVYHNNFIHNSALDYGSNTWDNDYPAGGNYWTFHSGDDDDNDGIIDTPYDIPGGENQDRYPFVQSLIPPEKPRRPSGLIVGETGKEYSYTSSTTDINGDQIQYGWDWDGDLRVDFWSDFYESGETCTATHSWNEKGTYLIYVIAMDIRGIESDWSEPLPISIPRIKNSPLSSFEKFSELFPNLFQLIQRVIYL